MDNELKYLYFKGKELFNSDSYDEAREVFEKFLEKNTNFADVYNYLGLIYHSADMPDEAIASFESALKINENYADAALNLTVIYNDRGDYVKAKELYGRIQRQSHKAAEGQNIRDKNARSKLANMHMDIGDIYSSMGVYEEALDEYEKALKLAPQFVDIITKRGATLRDLGRTDEAISEIERALNLRQNYLIGWINLGLAYLAADRLDDAENAWLKAEELAPNDKRITIYRKLLEEKRRK